MVRRRLSSGDAHPSTTGVCPGANEMTTEFPDKVCHDDSPTHDTMECLAKLKRRNTEARYSWVLILHIDCLFNEQHSRHKIGCSCRGIKRLVTGKSSPCTHETPDVSPIKQSAWPPTNKDGHCWATVSSSSSLRCPHRGKWALYLLQLYSATEIRLQESTVV